MKSAKLSFDFSDKTELVEVLRLEAARTGNSMKGILVEALESYFANRLENRLLTSAASQSFAEWDNEEDAIYDDI